MNHPAVHSTAIEIITTTAYTIAALGGREGGREGGGVERRGEREGGREGGREGWR